MKTAPSAYTLVMNTIYLSLRTQVAEGTVFMKHVVFYRNKYIVCRHALK